MSGINEALAVLRAFAGASPRRHAAVDRVEAEIARLEEDRDSWVRSADLAVQTWEAREAKQHARAEAAEARCARLQQALREIEDMLGNLPLDHLGPATKRVVEKAWLVASHPDDAHPYWHQVTQEFGGEALAGPGTPADSQPEDGTA